MLEPQRSGLWTTAGVVGVAGGGLFSLAAAGMLTIAVITKLPVRGAAAEPGLMPFVYSDARILPAFFLFMGGLAVAAGIGLLKRRQIGRSLALSFCVVASAWVVFAAVHLWLKAFSYTGMAPLLFRVMPIVVGTPIVLLIAAALVVFFRLLRAHPGDFS